MAKTKNVNPSKKLSDGARIVGNLNYGFSWRDKPICDAALEKLADDLVQWSKDTKEIDIECFFDERDLNIDSAYVWMERNECFKEAYKKAMQRLGSKRSRGAATFKLKDTWLRVIQYRYHPAFGQGEERSAKLNQSASNSTGNVTAVFEAVPEEDKVSSDIGKK